MADRVGARKDGQFKAVSTAPSFNKTPVGSSTPPLPYPVKEDLGSSLGVVDSVKFNGDPAYVLNQSTQPSCKGDAAGSCKGVKSGTVSGEVKPVKGSSTVRLEGKPIIRDGDPCTLNGGNCPGIYVVDRGPECEVQGGAPSASTNPPVKPETPKEASWWSKASPWVHGALGVASFVPGLSIVTGGADAAIYAAEGELVEAGLAAASMIPGGKVVTTAGKVAKEAAGLIKGARATEEAAKIAKAAEAAKAAKAAREAEEAAKLKKAEDQAAKAKKAEEEATKASDGAKIKQRRGGPCDHLRQGSGTGPYRGGAHSKTSKPANDTRDSHHMPADDVSPLARREGPAIQMDPSDHKMTGSNGSSREAVRYRQLLQTLLKDGKWREAMRMEIQDIRAIATEVGDPKKYNEAMLEMLEYFKCLEKHGLLPKG
jgi:uncharacterized Zn-binding protein involved in type VI secretion